MFHRNGVQVNGSFVLGFDHDRPDVFETTVQVDRGAATGVCDVSHFDALSGNAAV